MRTETAHPTEFDGFKGVFDALAAGRGLSRELCRWAFGRVMAGEVPDATVAALLGAMMAKGETVEELVGAAEAMRHGAIRIECDANCIDTCGTGGDGISTFNASTTAAIIAAAAGATVAKHGNRSTTRASGSTEVLERLGVNVEAGPKVVERCLRENRIGYLNARLLHPTMKFAAAARHAIPRRTVFNLLGPLTNPAGVRRQLVGVPSNALLELVAEALLRLGVLHAWVVHGEDGLCDLTITGSTTVVEVREGRRTTFRVSPKDVGLPQGTLDGLRVNSAAESADRVLEILNGELGARRNHALLNAGAALVVSGRASDWGEGVQWAARAIDDGSAAEMLAHWRRLSHAV